MRAGAVVMALAVAAAGCAARSATETARVPDPVPVTDPIVAVHERGEIRITFTIENAGEGRLTWIAVLPEFLLARGAPMQRLPVWDPGRFLPRQRFNPPLRKGERAAVGLTVPAAGLAAYLRGHGLTLADVRMDLCISHNGHQGAHPDGTIVPLPGCVGNIRIVAPGK